MKTVIVVQARMTSTRLPGKILKPVLGKPLLAYELERLQRVANADEIRVATTVNAADDPVEALCRALDVPVSRGPEADVLERYLIAARASDADVIVRCTADCPLIDPALVEHVIDRFLVDGQPWDYVSNTVVRTYPRGMDTEVFSRQALEIAGREASTTHQREHVTPFFYQQPDRFRQTQVVQANDSSHHRWTVDVPEDFELIRRILEALDPSNPHFTMEDVLDVLEQHPEWVALNANVEQKA